MKKTATTNKNQVSRRFRQRLLRLSAWSMVALFAFVVLKSQFDSLQTKSAISSTRPNDGVTTSVKPLWETWFEAWRNTTPTANVNANANANANNVTPPKPLTPTRVWVDVESLARRHAAWRLAEQLASRAPTENIIAPVAPPQNRFFADNDFAFNNNFRRTDSERYNTEDRVLDVSSFLHSRSNSAFSNSAVDTRIESALTRRARASQNTYINNLSRDLSRDLSRERMMRESESRAILEEEIEAARTAGLFEISPILLSEIEQLELTNLRLKLLPSSILREDEKRRARERLLILQSRWDEALRRQEAQNLANIEELRDVEPRRLRVEGETAISLSQSRSQAADAARLRVLRESQNALLARDFDALQPLKPLSARTSIAIFAAPASPLPSSANRSKINRIKMNRAPSIEVLPTQVEDRVLVVASNEQANASKVSAATQIANLRAQARREAQAWTRFVAQRRGWQVAPVPVSGGTKLRNATEEVWRAWQK